VHEYSLARAIIREVESVRAARCLGGIEQIALEVGEFSGVEPELLRSACEDLGVQQWGCRVDVVIKLTPLEAECQRCRTVFRVEHFQFRCRACDHTDVRVVRGEELKLVSIRGVPAEVVA
jgi:hydrogenase nickel incorporation protein HypA/HybF